MTLSMHANQRPRIDSVTNGKSAKPRFFGTRTIKQSKLGARSSKLVADA